MSESMVERVARAICAETGCIPDAMIGPNETLTKTGLGFSGFGDSKSHAQWEFYKAEARAAMRAMREPTEAMCIAGDVAQSAWEDRYNGGNARKAWEAMLDAPIVYLTKEGQNVGMKEELCRAFCNEISVREVPVGLVVSTPFRRSDGDPIGFYVVRNQSAPSMARLEDDGQTVPYLEACGVDFETQTRAKAFHALLVEYGAQYDEHEALIHTTFIPETEIPRVAIRFTALLLRLTDFLLLTQEHVESTFREDATKRIRERVGEA